jgi:sporulation protein YlmC with PRC-barrel domain
MRIDYHQLIKIPVETESGVGLGRVIGLELDTEKQAVMKYIVAQSKFFAEKLFISPSQIVRITAEKIVVEDAVGAEKQTTMVAERFSAAEAPTTNAEING